MSKENSLENPCRILVADDEKVFLEATADLLRDEGYVCDCVTDAQNAIKMLNTKNYDLLIADIKMPGNLELELIQGLRERSEGLPIILVTGYPTLNTAVMSTRLSVAGYLLKPIDFDELLKLVKDSITQYRTMRIFNKAQKRLREFREELTTLESLKNIPAANSPHVNVDNFLAYTLKNIMASLVDLKDLTQGLAQNRPKEDVCQLLNCPRHAELTDELRNVVFVLEKTKTSFKSKELAALRKRLDRIINGNSS